MIYNENDIAGLRVAAVHFALEAPTEFWNLPASEMVTICNGFGPGKWFKWVRKKLTALCGEYAVTAAIHDVQQEFCTVSSKAASKIFLVNSLKIWLRRHGVKGLLIFSAFAELFFCISGFLALYFLGEKYWKATPGTTEGGAK